VRVEPSTDPPNGFGADRVYRRTVASLPEHLPYDSQQPVRTPRLTGAARTWPRTARTRSSLDVLVRQLALARAVPFHRSHQRDE
jgi:hypothetical protein